MKRVLHKIICVFFVILMLPLFSLTAWAEDYRAVLNSLHFDIELCEDGSAYITETREVEFIGDHEFTRYGVNNIFTGPRVFSDWQVSIDGMSVPQLDEPDNENRPENTFAVEDGDGRNTVYIYIPPQSNSTRIFQISYRVENAVKLHYDVGEFFWNLTAESGISDIGKLTATLTVPDGVPTEEFRIWAHGPLNGTFEKQPDGSAFLQVDNVSLGTIVDIRSTMPAYCFNGGWEQEGEALDDILAEEKELADSANAKREEEERQRAEQDANRAKREAWEAKHPILNFLERFCQKVCISVYFFLEEHIILLVVIIVLSFPVLFLTGIFYLIASIVKKIKMKCCRKHPTQSPQYYRDLPDDRPAPAVDRLIHFYDGKPNISRQISAALLELDLKKLVRFQSAEGDPTILLNKQLGKEMFPHTPPQETAEPEETAEPAPEHIASYQETLWNFLSNAADESGRISIKDLKGYIRDNLDESMKFRSNFSDAVEREYTERVKTEDQDTTSSKSFKPYLIISAAAGILAMLIHILATVYDGIHIVPILLAGIITFVAALIVLALIRYYIHLVDELSAYRILDQQSEDDLALWQAFGRFLDDFTTFEDKELPEFPVWREYMVYAVAIGSGKKVAKALALKYPEAMSSGNDDAYNDDMYYFMQNMDLYDAMDSIGREVSYVRAPGSSGGDSDSSSWTDSSWSDGGGDGGGFSDSGGGGDSGSGGDFAD